MALSDDLDDLRDQLDSRPPMVKYGDKPGLTIPNPDMNNNLDTVVVGGDVAIEAARIAITAGEDAFASRQSAEQSAVIASDAAITVVDAKDVVVAAEAVAVDAKNAAVQANTDAQAAKDEAVTARDETVEAKDILVPAIDETLEARDQAVAASTTAVSAADTATTKAGEAVVSADLAEFWADAAEASSGVAGLGESIAGLPKIKPILNLDFINQKQLLKGVNFSRATPTWDYDEHGNFRKYEIDEPCFAYDPVTGEAKGLQVYPQRTNLFVDSTNMPLASTTGIIRGGEIESVDGWGILAKGIEMSNEAESSYYYGSMPLEQGQIYTFSAYISVEGGGEPVVGPRTGNDVGIYISGGTVSLTLNPLVHIIDDVWFVSATREATSASNNTGFIKQLVHSNKKITFWGYQIEKSEHATPYIPTEGSQVTVAATNLQIDGELFDSVYNSQQGTMLFDVGENYFLTTGSTSPYLNLGLLGAGTGGASGTGSFGTTGTSLVIRDATGTEVVPSLPIPKRLDRDPQLGNPYKLGISYTHDQQSIAAYGEVATSSRDASGFLESSASRIFVHPYTSGYIKGIQYYNRALTETQLEEITSNE